MRLFLTLEWFLSHMWIPETQPVSFSLATKSSLASGWDHFMPCLCTYSLYGIISVELGPCLQGPERAHG